MVLLYCLLISTGTLLISLHDTYLFSLFCLQEFLESSYPWISKILWKCQLLHIFIHQTLARPPSVKIHIILSVLKNCFLFFDFFFLVFVSNPSHRFPWLTVVVESLSCVQPFCGPMDSSLPGSSVQGISQARILEWVAIPFSRGSS